MPARQPDAAGSARKSRADPLLADTPVSPQLEMLARALGWEDCEAEAGSTSLSTLRKFINSKGWPEIERTLILIVRGEFLSGLDEGLLQDDEGRSLRKVENARTGIEIIRTLLSDDFVIHLPGGAKEKLR
jgi:hypothetical protein